MHSRFSIRAAAFVLGAFALVGCNDIGPDLPTFLTKPTQMNDSRPFVDLSLGDSHSCGLQADGQVFCWGLNTQGQSGNGVTGESAVGDPRLVIGGVLFSSISAGGSHTCGISKGGITMCWGNNVGGQLGVANSSIARFEPTPVSGGHTFIQVSASTFAHTCGLKANGEVWCWGFNENGQLGTGNLTNSIAPVQVGGGIKFTRISAGGAHTCGIAADSSAYCWGRNDRGQIGDGTNDQRLIPTKVATTTKFIRLALGLAHTCALADNGHPYCWGDNVVGAVGDGTTTARSSPSLVTGVTFVDIVAGERHNCGIDDSGGVRCWGFNNAGPLGDGTTDMRTEPVPLFTAVVFKKIAAGAYHTCGISTADVTYCWGDNYAFQLGSIGSPEG